MLEKIKEFSAEKIINGIKTRSAKPAMGSNIDYKDYDTDRDLVYRFTDLLPYENLEKINAKLNESATEYEGENYICPSCGKHLDLIGNDGNFCKFCGQEIKRESEKTFGECVKEMRLEAGLNQTELAKMIGASTSRICLLERGTKDPTKEEIISLSYAFKCSVNKLFNQPVPREEGGEFTASYDGFVRPTLNPEELIKEMCDEGYESEYIYKCPICNEEVNLTIDESLTLGLDFYEITKERSEGNDGAFCKHCGQALKRPLEIDRKKVINNFGFWIRKAAK